MGIPQSANYVQTAPQQTILICYVGEHESAHQVSGVGPKDFCCLGRLLTSRLTLRSYFRIFQEERAVFTAGMTLWELCVHSCSRDHLAKTVLDLCC
jgi:hypothetical protein